MGLKGESGLSVILLALSIDVRLRVYARLTGKVALLVSLYRAQRKRLRALIGLLVDTHAIDA